MTRNKFITLILATALLSACSKEPEPRTVAEFLEDPHLLEAALVRCSANGVESRYAAECMNAREAVKQIEAQEAAARREELEAESQRKRDALRRSQAAAQEARRRAEEQRQQQEEADYLANFGAPLPESSGNVDSSNSNVPGAILPDSTEGDSVAPQYEAPPVTDLPTDDATVVEPQDAQEPDLDAADLGDIRDELKRRNNGDGNG